ncbi:MAG: GNAT family N-acetyltransferase, partial [Actinomycetales bacterium]
MGRRRPRHRRGAAAHLARDVRRRRTARGPARRRRGRCRGLARVAVEARDARNRVLVALERNTVVGFAITSPASDPDCDPVADGELSELNVDPAKRGLGHGSRLLQAAVDTM